MVIDKCAIRSAHCLLDTSSPASHSVDMQPILAFPCIHYVVRAIYTWLFSSVISFHPFVMSHTP